MLGNTNARLPDILIARPLKWVCVTGQVVFRIHSVTQFNNCASWFTTKFQNWLEIGIEEYTVKKFHL